ncbi:MAG: DUF892 family protein [Actinobacteria bacterium]|nr:DUF892 family protein [Actinomycetota bacterium]
METLDGMWNVERVSGVMPPLLGIRKRIEGARGETALGALPGVPFRVQGLELHYEPPLSGFVDRLEPHGEGYSGRAFFRGREYGTFTLRRREVAGSAVESRLVKHLDEAFALEQNVRTMLDGMIRTTDDPGLREAFEQHREETRRHADLMRGRLEAHGAKPSLVREAGGILGALTKLPLDLVRGDRAARNARDAYVTEHLEIAGYELLERIARRAEDDETVEACRSIRHEEQAMAERIAASWDAVAG